MPERELEDDSALEFESVPARADVRVSKKFETRDGDQIRVIHLVGGNAVLAKAGGENGPLDSVYVSGDSKAISEKKKGFWEWLWGKIKSIAKKVGKAISDADCKWVQEAVINEEGVEEFKTTLKCSIG